MLEEILAETVAIHALLGDVVALLTPKPPAQATTAVFIGGDMPLDVGATETVTLTFVDGNDTPPSPQAPPKGDGSGLVVTIASSDSTIASVGPTTASGNTAIATASGVAVGTFTYTATVANASGAPLLDDDGTTPFIQPVPLASSVVAAPPPAAQATTGVLSAPSAP